MSNSKSSFGGGTFGGRRGGRSAGLLELRVRPHHSWWVQILLLVWRWRAELLTTLLILAGISLLTDRIGGFPTLLLLAGLTFVTAALPWTRRYVYSHALCTVTRHRLRLFFVEGGIYNRSGRLPWIVWVRPTPVGERAWVFMTPGLSCEVFENRLTDLASTCLARDARYQPVRSFIALVRVDVIRHDPLATGKRTKPIRSLLLRGTADFGSTDLPDTPAAATAATAATKASTSRAATATTRTVGLARPATTPAPRTPSGSPAGTPTPPAQLPPPAVLNKHGEDISDYVD